MNEGTKERRNETNKQASEASKQIKLGMELVKYSRLKKIISKTYGISAPCFYHSSTPCL